MDDNNTTFQIDHKLMSAVLGKCDIDSAFNLFNTLLMKVGSLLIRCFVLCLLAQNAFSQNGYFRLDQGFSSGMVLQRNQPITFSGRDNGYVIVTFDNEKKTVKADENGRWSVTFAPRPAGGPYEVDFGYGNQYRLRNVMVGDVFLCSGQSNMEWAVRQASNADYELSKAANPNIRLLKVPKNSSARMEDRFKEWTSWEEATQETVKKFSALCFFTGQMVEDKYKVPVGLIDASWGGSRIEPWISAKRLSRVPEVKEKLTLLKSYGENPNNAKRVFAKQWESWWKSKGDGEPWNGSGVKWKSFPGAKGSWKASGIEELKQHDGMVWFKHEFELTGLQASQKAKLSLGGIDEIDIAWVNGKFVGEKFGWGDMREYEVPKGYLKPGKNTIVLNVLSFWGDAGLMGPYDAMKISFEDSTEISISNTWDYSKVSRDIGFPPQVPWQSIGGISTIYNGMIAPLGNMPLKGVLWYQGESNTGEGKAYKRYLELLIADWRERFGEKTPFVVIQLPNFGETKGGNQESGWSELRESQRLVARKDPLTEIVVTIDIGDKYDIHPTNKRAVAERVFRKLRHMVYGDKTMSVAPVPESIERLDDERILIRFKNFENNHYIVGGNQLIGFEVCDGTKNCRFVSAQPTKNGVILLDRRSAPGSNKSVRYCWGDSPLCNLFDGASIPVVPFLIELK